MACSRLLLTIFTIELLAQMPWVSFAPIQARRPHHRHCCCVLARLQALVYKNGAQAPNGKEVYNPHYTKPKPRPKRQLGGLTSLSTMLITIHQHWLAMGVYVASTPNIAIGLGTAHL
jgi:hypothetical protein